MAHKKFGQKKKTDETVEAPEPITFDLADEEGFACRARVNGKLLIELVGKVDSTSIGQQAEGILQVFEVCVRVDDGDNPDGYTGKPYEKHTIAELQQIDDENDSGDDDDDEREMVVPGIDPTSSLGRLRSLLDDPNTEIEIEELAELVGWLVEQYTGRPTKSAANSRGGPRNMKHSSRRARRSQERTIAKEAQRGASTSSTELSLTSS